MVMRQISETRQIMQQLREQVVALEGYKPLIQDETYKNFLGPIERAFPHNVFPTGCIHEFISPTQNNAAATDGFISGILGNITNRKTTCLWVSTDRKVFPGALKLFGIDPHQILFIDTCSVKDALWTIEEGLKCGSLAAVVGELKNLSFTESRRLQLAVEQSQVTGFIHRVNSKNNPPIAAISRWRITSLHTNATSPGIGLPRWNVELIKVRNGRPGSWQLEWLNNNFQHIIQPDSAGTGHWKRIAESHQYQICKAG